MTIHRRLPLLLIALGLAATTSWGGLIEGRVIRGELPRAGVTVTAHAGVDPSLPPLATATSGEDGRYRLLLPPGRYALFAGEAATDTFGFCGRNPLDLTDAEPVWAGIRMVPRGKTTRTAGDDPYGATVEGVVLLDGRPLAGAIVTLYLDVADDLKGQGYRASLPTGDDGLFAFDGLPEADYHLVARHRAGGAKAGPVRDGDDLALFSGNPLRAPSGRTTRVELHAVRKIQESATADKPSTGPTVAGTVVDRAGRPVAGLHAFAYTDKVIGHKRPAAISLPTAADGRFQLAFPKPGIYYVGVREAYGDSPAPGELFGMYDATADHSLKVETKEQPGSIRIVVEPVSLH